MIWSLEVYLGFILGINVREIKFIKRERDDREIYFLYDSSVIIVDPENITVSGNLNKILFGKGLESKAYQYFCLGYFNYREINWHTSTENKRLIRAGRKARHRFINH